jgi:ATP-dependent Clp protease ATP-binding subunit ClpC
MFERYTEPARRAIFFARAIAIINNAPAIDSSNLLWGLMWPDTSRAQVLFGLREKFPRYLRRPHDSLLFATLKGRDLPLNVEGKKILYRSMKEADAMGDAWVDTDHLLLGILCEPNSHAAELLVKAGITLENARLKVLENRSSRPDYGPVIPLGETPSPRVWLKSKWCWWKARWSEKRFAMRRKN